MTSLSVVGYFLRNGLKLLFCVLPGAFSIHFPGNAVIYLHLEKNKFIVQTIQEKK